VNQAEREALLSGLYLLLEIVEDAERIVDSLRDAEERALLAAVHAELRQAIYEVGARLHVWGGAGD
jgi:hypothetical protein